MAKKKFPRTKVISKGIAGTKDDARRKGSPYYLINRGIPPRIKKYNTGEEIWAVAEEYFAAVDGNPMMESKVFGSGYETDVTLQIPYTLSGFHVFAGISQVTFDKYCGYDKREDATEEEIYLATVSQYIKKVIYTQKLEGANAGKFNHSIVALELGLSAKVQQEVITHDSSKMSVDEIKKFNDQLEDEY